VIPCYVHSFLRLGFGSAGGFALETIKVKSAEVVYVFTRQNERPAQPFRYAPRMDLADGCLVVLAARDADAVVLTTDTRDFSTYRVPFASPEGLFAAK
jgi:predicted nucleic acid-binding protein